MLNRLTLTLVFTFSFLSYMTEDLNTSIQAVPLALFAILVFFKVLCSKSVLEAVGSLFEFDGLVFVVFVSALTIAPSLASGTDKSFETAMIIAVCLVLARLYTAVVPIQEILEAYFWSGILSVIIFIPLSLVALVHSVETLERFSAFSFHPNLLAFVLAGYFCAMVWKFLTGDWRMKILTGLVGFMCLTIIFFASSRGSIVAILVGGFFTTGMAFVVARREARRKVLRLGLLAAVMLLVLSVQNLVWIQNTTGFIDEVLQLSQGQRGTDSGFSGRLDKWRTTLRVFSDGTWLVGRGIRSSDSMEDQLIDNSFLVILYEIGVLPLILITWRFFSVTSKFIAGYFRAAGRDQRQLYLFCSLAMVVLLVNSIVARLLFGVGNPYSLLAFFVFAAPTSHIVPGLSKYRIDQREFSDLTNASASSTQALI